MKNKISFKVAKLNTIISCIILMGMVMFLLVTSHGFKSIDTLTNVILFIGTVFMGYIVGRALWSFVLLDVWVRYYIGSDKYTPGKLPFIWESSKELPISPDMNINGFMVVVEGLVRRLKNVVALDTDELRVFCNAVVADRYLNLFTYEKDIPNEKLKQHIEASRDWIMVLRYHR